MASMSRRLVSVSRLGTRRIISPSIERLKLPTYSLHRGILQISRLQSSSSTTRPTATSSYSSGSLLATVLAASTLSGLAGFLFARQQPDADDTLTNPQFGTPEDYERGIEELRTTLPSKDMVSTNPDDLLAHGWSSHVWHPGKSHRYSPFMLYQC